MDIKRTLVGIATTMVAAGSLAAGAAVAQSSSGVVHDMENQAVVHDMRNSAGSGVVHDM
jgi:hypothetical protein